MRMALTRTAHNYCILVRVAYLVLYAGLFTGRVTVSRAGLDQGVGSDP